MQKKWPGAQSDLNFYDSVETLKEYTVLLIFFKYFNEVL